MTENRLPQPKPTSSTMERHTHVLLDEEGRVLEAKSELRFVGEGTISMNGKFLAKVESFSLFRPLLPGPKRRS